MIIPYLSYLINDHKTQGKWKVYSGNKIIDYKTQSKWKIQLTMKINFISSKDSEETRNTSTKSDNVEIMMGSETDKIIEELFESLLQRYQEESEKSMKGREFVSGSVDLLYYKLNKIKLNRGGSYIDSPE